MDLAYTYKPLEFFLITLIGTWIFLFLAAYFSFQKDRKKILQLCMILGICVPFIVAISLIYVSKDAALIKDFWNRLFLFKLSSSSIIMLLVAIPSAFLLSTALSLLFGQSKKQFAFTKEFNVMKGWNILGAIIAIFLAPTLEELGWRGYGVDSLKSSFNLFNTSLIFAFLWGLWHLPLFFIKGYYHYELRSLNPIYVINFFVSLLPASILLNWIYYQNNRSILAVILLHAMINAFSVLFKIEQVAKCLVTILLGILSAIIVFNERVFFFK